MRECGSGCERCASHNEAVRKFYKDLSDDAVLDKFPSSTRKWAKDLRRAGVVGHAGVAGCADLGGGDRPAEPDRGLISAPLATFGSGDFIPSNSGYCNTAAALTPYAAPPTVQPIS